MEEIFEITEELMLDGLKIVQDKRYYRFTSDSVLLSKFAKKAKRGETVADFCAGSGIVGLHYYGLNKKNVKSVHLFELQSPLINLAQKSVEINGLGDKFTVVGGRLQDAPASFNGAFSLILCNPPYKKAGGGEQNLSEHIAACRHETQITLEEIIACSKRMLKPCGTFCICQRVERLCDLMFLLRTYGLEPYEMAFVRTENGAPYLVMINAAKDKKPQLKVFNEIIN